MHAIPVPFRNRRYPQFFCGSHRITALDGIDIIFWRAAACAAPEGKQQRCCGSRASEAPVFAGVLYLIRHHFAVQALSSGIKRSISEIGKSRLSKTVTLRD
jgi:hypothetical protein